MVADFGESYVPGSSHECSASAKRFRGTLDALFQKQLSSMAESEKAAEADAGGAAGGVGGDGAGADAGA